MLALGSICPVIRAARYVDAKKNSNSECVGVGTGIALVVDDEIKTAIRAWL